MNQNVVNRIQSPSPKKILACDGGGMLGLMSVEILLKIEEELRNKLGKGPDFVLADYFDFVCGTSTGAINATCISSGMSMARIRQFYLDSGKQMFDNAKNILGALMNAASACWDMTCRLLGECRHGVPIDREFGDMVMPGGDDLNWSGSKLFTYMSYNPDVTQAGLKGPGLNYFDAGTVQVMDSVEYIPTIQRVGKAYAAEHFQLQHFEGFLS